MQKACEFQWHLVSRLEPAVKLTAPVGHQGWHPQQDAAVRAAATGQKGAKGLKFWERACKKSAILSKRGAVRSQGSSSVVSHHASQQDMNMVLCATLALTADCERKSCYHDPVLQNCLCQARSLYHHRKHAGAAGR